MTEKRAILDWILLRRDEITELLAGYGLTNPRVAGWAGAGLDLPAPAEIHADRPQVTDLTSGDLRRLDQRLTALLGFEALVVPVIPGSTDLQPGERAHYL